MIADSPPDIRWFHSFDLGNGRSIEGIKPLAILQQEADLIFGDGVCGRSVLDVGAWDGFFSFEAERRGASQVLATDHFCWSGQGWGTRAGFDYIHEATASNVQAMDVDIQDLHTLGVRQFDLVLFLGVFYHLKDPYAGLEFVSDMARDELIVETVTALPHEKLPAMRLFAQGELAGDPTNFWAPNLPALELMLRNFGFRQIEFVASPVSPNHPLRAGRLSRAGARSAHRTIVRARR